jgi:hypothetical protein
MATVVDSKEQFLSAPEIIMRFAQDFNDTGYPLQNVLAAIAQELSMPGTDQVQIGNTVFVGHTGEGEHKNVMEGSALNVDSGRNFVRNGLKYIAYLQNKGIRYYRTDLQRARVHHGVPVMVQKERGAPTLRSTWYSYETGGYRAYIYIGDESLKEFWRI